jgi:hypothetical protein
MMVWRKGFFQSSSLAWFLNVLEADEQGSIHLDSILRPRALALVAREVDAEMENAKPIFRMSTKEVTPEYLLSFNIERSLTIPLQETTPWLRRILMSAMQTMCAVKENKHQNVETVSIYFIIHKTDVDIGPPVLHCNPVASCQHLLAKQSCLSDHPWSLLIQWWYLSQSH